jgi:hypothetical protein
MSSSSVASSEQVNRLSVSFLIRLPRLTPLMPTLSVQDAKNAKSDVIALCRNAIGASLRIWDVYIRFGPRGGLRDH